MSDFLIEAREELKRSDHLFYVSLKYTRMVDVIRNLIQRLINALEKAIDALLADAEEKKLIAERPGNIALKAELLKRTVKEPWVEEMVNFFMLLRRIHRAEFKRSREFRRHVTMTAIMEGGILEINIDKVKEYYEQTVAFVDRAEERILGRKLEEF